VPYALNEISIPYKKKKKSIIFLIHGSVDRLKWSSHLPNRFNSCKYELFAKKHDGLLNDFVNSLQFANSNFVLRIVMLTT
jgi:hypothetical protein